jgi:photosystem I subunit 10
MLHSALLFAAAPMSQPWSPTVAIVMVICNVLGVLAATTSKSKVGPALPVGGLTLGQFVGGACFGHILGAGTILGLTSIGAI